MRKSYKDFLNKSDINFLNKLPLGGLRSIKNDSNEVIDKIIETLSNDFKFTIKDKSYWAIEQKSEGHQWHKDTGSNNHMLWCEVGCTMLLDGEFEGGETLYRKDGVERVIERSSYELLAHTSDEEHMVKPSDGNRKVLLIFI